MPRARHIAIDRPAGTGKSTVGSRLADFLDYAYLDTGIMYRALTCLALEKRIHVNDSCALDDLCQALHLVISSSCIIDRRQYAVSINGKEISRTALHNVEVTHAVPLVSAHVEVRRLLRDRQRQLAHVGQFVMIGCDIGTVVLPDADLKIFLTASLEERACRRYKELLNQCERNALLLEDYGRRFVAALIATTIV